MSSATGFETPRGRVLPVSLAFVAFIFVLGGAVSTLAVIDAASRGRVSVQLGVLGWFVGFGLLRLVPGWRTFALVIIWAFGLIGVPVATLMMVGSPRQVEGTILGMSLGRAPWPVVVLLGAACWLLSLWQLRVLTRPDIRALFVRRLNFN